MNDVDVLIPEPQEIWIGKRSYLLGELSLLQTLKVGKFIVKSIFNSKEKLDALAKEAEGSTDNMQDALKIIELLDEDKIPELISIILKENDIEYLHTNLTPTNTSEIIAVLCENNDFLTLKKNINRIMKAVKKEKES